MTTALGVNVSVALCCMHQCPEELCSSISDFYVQLTQRSQFPLYNPLGLRVFDYCMEIVTILIEVERFPIDTLVIDC